MYEIIIWDGKPETAERIFKATGETGDIVNIASFKSTGEHLSLMDNVLHIGEEVLLPGERIVATKHEWWMESRRYPRRVEKAEGEQQCAL